MGRGPGSCPPWVEEEEEVDETAKGGAPPESGAPETTPYTPKDGRDDDLAM
jgi:hypothetical protein